MKFDEIRKVVGNVPFIQTANAEYLYNLIIAEKLRNILELGIAHGTATCYMAAALHELGDGRITSVDLLETAQEFQPTPEEQLERAGLSSFVQIVRMQTGYTWYLHDKIVQNSDNCICRPEYDLCVIDGPKNWTIDGAAFFLVDKLLKPNGRIIFDDYSWTYASADTRRSTTDGITHRSLSQAERETPHIRDVFEFLVVQHPNYSNFVLLPESSWAIAQKKTDTAKTYTVLHRHEDSARDIVAKGVRKLQRIIRGG